MDRYDYIESIILFLKGVTGINYQLKIKEILSIYYKYRGKSYEMPDFYGGDQKNDGWVIEDGIFYQIYAPTRLKDSLKKEIQEKFIDDLRGLLEIIYEEKKWAGKLNEFIFIVNTFDNNLPHDSERFFETKVKEFEDKYSVDFDFRVVNTDYIRDILTEIQDIEVLKQISAALHIKSMIDNNGITEQIITDLIIGIAGNLSSIVINGATNKSYNRISSIEKIDINDLSDVVENAVNSINQDILCENKFERVKQFIIEKYIELSTTLHGVELYESLVNDILSYSNEQWNLETPMKFLIVYIFDKCDIFEKSR
mgnify:FL=1